MPRYPQRERSRAILLGTDQYDNYAALPAVVRNLEEFRHALVLAKRGGFPSEHCHTIPNPLDPAELAVHIKDVAAQATDVLLVYCCGHGLIDKGQLQLALQHTTEDRLHWTALPVALLKEAITSSPAAIKVLIVECCYSGLVIPMADASEMLHQQSKVAGAYTLTSSSSDEISVAPAGEEFTAFGGALVRLLREPPPGHPDGASLNEIFRLISQELEDKGYPLPQQSAGNSAGDLTLVGWDNGADGDNDVPVVFIPPSAGDVADAPGSTEDEYGPVVAPEVVRLLGHAERDDAEIESLSDSEIDQRLSELLQQAKQIHNVDDNDETPTNVLATLGKIVTTMIGTGSNEHPHVLLVRDMQSFWLAKAGRADEARDMLERVLRVREQIHGAEHPEVLGTRHNLAHIIGLTGQAGEAARLLQQLVEDRERILGRSNLDTQLSLDSLAYWSGMSGDPAKAVEIYDGLRLEREWQFGSTDRSTLDVQEKLANWAGRAGDAARAVDTYDQLITNWAKLPEPRGWNEERAKKNRDYWSARVQNEDNQ